VKVNVDETGALTYPECPIYRIRLISDSYKGLLLVSVNGTEMRVTKAQWSALREFMQRW